MNQNLSEELIKKLEFNLILNHISGFCFLEQTKEKLFELKFFTERSDVERELKKVEQTKNLLLSGFIFDFDNLRDIRPIIQELKISGNFIGGDRLRWVLDFLKISRLTKHKFREFNKNRAFSEIEQIFYSLYENRVLEHNIDITVDENGNIRDSASAELRKIREDINNKSIHLRKIIKRILKTVSELELTQDDIYTLRDGRLVIPVRVENKRKLKGIIHSLSGSGATAFIEPQETIELNNEIAELKIEEQRIIESLLLEIAKELSNYLEEFSRNTELLSELDILQAKARYAIESGGLIPELSEDKCEIVKGYHPVLLMKKKDTVVPITVDFGNEIKTIIITGPNAGGKTVALKTIGLLQIMLQSGFLIPVNPVSKFKLFKKIFVSIGDEQSVEFDLSSFSSHLKTLKNVIDNADNNSLVLIDEICTGTDPTFGAALSSAILKHLTFIGANTIVTTHIGSLKHFAYLTEGITNASLEFDVNTLSPTYNFSMGIPGQSFTFEIAKRYGIPDEILTDAQKFLKAEEIDIESLLRELAQNKQKYTELKRQFDRDNSRLQGLIKIYEERISELNNNKNKILKETKLEAEKILLRANALIERTIREIREQEKIQPKIIKSKFEKEKSELLSSFPKEEIVIESFSEGELVRLKDSNATGQIISIDGDSVILIINNVQVKTNKSNLEKIKNQDEAFTLLQHSRKYEVKTDSFLPELDLRGSFPEEIKDKIEEFISNAINNAFYEVRIIHGKGTGKLREETRKIIQRIPEVESFRFGNWNEGDTGVTIIKLKHSENG